MHQWILVCCIGSSVGSATTVVSMGIKLQSVKVVVKHHNPTDACLTNTQYQSKTSNKHRIRIAIFCIYKKLLTIYKVFQLKGFNTVRVLIVSCSLTNDRLTGRKI